MVAKRPRGPPALAIASASPLAIIGIDWSGARTAGKTIWLADGALLPPIPGEQQERVLRVSSVRCAASLHGGRPERAAAVAAVRDHLVRSAPAWVGLDAPIALPSGLMRAACGEAAAPSTWRAFVDGYRWTEAEEMREWARGVHSNGEPKRECDVTAKAPFAPTNLRLFRQTHTAISLLLAPMLRAGELSVIPPSLARDASSDEAAAAALRPVRLLETCPASLLKRVGLYGETYKATTTQARAARARILETLCGAGVASGYADDAPRVRLELHDGAAPSGDAHEQLPEPPEPPEQEQPLPPQSQLLRRAIVDDAGGDALDAVLAATITALAVSSGALPQPPEGWSDAFWEEGCIYY